MKRMNRNNHTATARGEQIITGGGIPADGKKGLLCIRKRGLAGAVGQSEEIT